MIINQLIKILFLDKAINILLNNLQKNFTKLPPNIYPGATFKQIIIKYEFEPNAITYYYNCKIIENLNNNYVKFHYTYWEKILNSDLIKGIHVKQHITTKLKNLEFIK